jgi:23S rRNA (cytidine1920-2'-O)/16S rRNA (cytidine1409-2'-O)-methyltransferase
MRRDMRVSPLRDVIKPRRFGRDDVLAGFRGEGAIKEAIGKVRLDKLLVEGGHVVSRERAQAMILAGRVLVNEQRIDKPGTAVAGDVTIRMLGDDLKYVSRGGLKLEKALDYWKIDVAGLACIDVGASTGGFTDCMLQAGARSVLAVDTGYGQIAEKFRHDERVTLRERTNARLLNEGELVREDPADTPVFLAMDVSFISATLVLPAVVGALALPGERWQGEAVVLVKPQFEAGRENVGKGGIVRDPDARKYAIERVWECAESLGGCALEVIDSPIRGMEGNHEYLLHVLFEGKADDVQRR